jgi:hypothetical protein
VLSVHGIELLRRFAPTENHKSLKSLTLIFGWALSDAFVSGAAAAAGQEPFVGRVIQR